MRKGARTRLPLMIHIRGARISEYLYDPCAVLAVLVPAWLLPAIMHCRRAPFDHITTHLPPQHPADDPSCRCAEPLPGPFIAVGAPDGYEDISLLYLRISRTMS